MALLNWILGTQFSQRQGQITQNITRSTFMVCPCCMSMGEGGEQPTGIRLSEAYVGGEFDILNVPLTQPPLKGEDLRMSYKGSAILEIPSSHFEFPTFWSGHIVVKDGRTNVRSILFCPSALRSNTSTKCHLKICFLLFSCFYQMLPSPQVKSCGKTWNSPAILC